MGSNFTGIVIAIVIVSLIVIVFLKVSATKRPCPKCGAMMPIKKTACPRCGKAIPLNY